MNSLHKDPKSYIGSECKVQVPGRGVWIESLRELHTGEARRLTAVFCTMDPVWFQIWIKEGDGWKLIWQKQWQPTKTNTVDYVSIRHGGQFHFVNSNSTQFHLVNSNSSIPNLSI